MSLKNQFLLLALLSVLTRNSALDMGGDSLVPFGPVSADGKRSYAVYRCLPVR